MIGRDATNDRGTVFSIINGCLRRLVNHLTTRTSIGSYPPLRVRGLWRHQTAASSMVSSHRYVSKAKDSAIISRNVQIVICERW